MSLHQEAADTGQLIDRCAQGFFIVIKHLQIFVKVFVQVEQCEWAVSIPY